MEGAAVDTSGFGALLLQFGLLLTGWVLHTLFKLYELDKATPGPVKIGQVLWEDAERWRTIMLLLFIGVVAFTGSVDDLLVMAGISTSGMKGLGIILICAGYNIDSLSAKALSVAKVKPESEG